MNVFRVQDLMYVRNTSQSEFLSAFQGSNNVLQYCRRLGTVCRHFVLKVYLPASINRKPGTSPSTICEALHDRDLVRHLGRCLFLITCVIFPRKQAVGKPANHQNICYQWKAGKNTARVLLLGQPLSNCNMEEEVNLKEVPTKRDTQTTKCCKHEK